MKNGVKCARESEGCIIVEARQHGQGWLPLGEAQSGDNQRYICGFGLSVQLPNGVGWWRTRLERRRSVVDPKGSS